MILVNGGHGQHDIIFLELNVKSSVIDQQGETTSVTFTVPDKDVGLTYRDLTHANLGMTGLLLVGNVAIAQSAELANNYQAEYELDLETIIYKLQERKNIQTDRTG